MGFPDHNSAIIVAEIADPSRRMLLMENLHSRTMAVSPQAILPSHVVQTPGFEFGGVVAKRGTDINKLFVCIDRGALCIQQHATQEGSWRISLFKRGQATTGDPFIAVDFGNIREIEERNVRSPSGNMAKGKTVFHLKQPINPARGLETLVILMDTQDHLKMHEHLMSL
jgi:hypothetical protein